MNAGPAPQAARTRVWFHWLSYGLVFLILACAALVIASLIRAAWPEWPSGMIAGILLFIVADRLYIHRHLKTLDALSAEWALTLAGQWTLMVLVARLLLAYAKGWTALRADLLLFARGDVAAFFAPELVIPLFPGVLLWYMAAQFLELLDEIGLDAAQPWTEEPLPIQSGMVPAHQRLVGQIFSLGIAVVVVTVLTRLNLRSILANQSGLPDVQVSRFSGAEGWALLYFVFGLTLLSLSRLMSLQTHWNRLRIPVASGDMVRRWAAYSLIFLLALGIFISLLPAGDTFGLFSVLGAFFGFVISVLFFLGQLLLGLLVLLFSLPFFLVGRSTGPMDNMPSAPPLPTLPIPPDPTVGENPAWVLARSILLWGALLVLVVFAVRQLLRDRDSVRGLLGRSRLAAWLALAWQWFYKGVDRTRAGLSRALAEGWQTLRERFEGRRLSPPAAGFRLGALDPRRQIYFFYLAMLRRGAEQGLGRKPSQTPSEYAAELENALSAAEEDIDSITQAFVEARYSRQDIDRGRANRVRQTWARIRQALRRRARREPGAKA